MASPEILYRGGELESLRSISGTPTSSTSTTYFDPAWSDCGVFLNGIVYRGEFRDSSGAPATVSGGDVLHGMSYHANLGGGNNGDFLTVYDTSGRPAVRISTTTAPLIQLQHNTSANTTPVWVTLGSYGIGGKVYVAFKVSTAATREWGLYIDGETKGVGTFTNPLIGDLAYFIAGPIGGVTFISQIQFSRGINLVGARVLTRKAIGNGTYQQMTGAYSTLVKTEINDATGVVSGTAGQLTTNQYQDVTVPVNMEMDNRVWIWNRVKNDGSSPDSMKQACIVNSVLQKGPDLPVDIGFQGLPYVLTGMTPALWNSCEVGQESSDI